MHEMIETLYNYHAAEILIVLAIVLILIDYLFPTDVPCHFGYFSFGVRRCSSWCRLRRCLAS